MPQLWDNDSFWIYAVPIDNLHLTEEINFELSVNSVCLIDAAHLPYRRKRLHFPIRISEIRKRVGVWNTVFDDARTLAVVGQPGTPNQTFDDVLQKIRDALAILSVSLLGYRQRQVATPAIADEEPARSRQAFAIDYNTSNCIGHTGLFGSPIPLELNAEWVRFHKGRFFFDLLKLLEGKGQLSENWRKDIRNAAVLAGQSQSSLHIGQCFLWNMIVIEVLLTEHGGDGRQRYSEKLPERAEALLGWVESWKTQNFYQTIRSMWKKRCEFVHDGKTDQISVDDLVFTDYLIFNLLHNIVEHIDLFHSKDDLIEFSKKVQAEKVLGLKPSVQPTTLRFQWPTGRPAGRRAMYFRR